MFVGRENELKILNRVFSSKRQESVLIIWAKKNRKNRIDQESHRRF
ncbi:hypothetical protein [Holdemanella biformis]|nr:hypothetical protein [Holdemanella biformis]